MKRAGVAKDEIDGLVLATYRLAPDNTASMARVFRLVDAFHGRSAVRRRFGCDRAPPCGAPLCRKREMPGLWPVSQPTPHPQASAAVPTSRDFRAITSLRTGPVDQNAVFAMITDNYMRKNNATREDILAGSAWLSAATGLIFRWPSCAHRFRWKNTSPRARSATRWCYWTVSCA